jgi:hypothetical protein
VAVNPLLTVLLVLLALAPLSAIQPKSLDLKHTYKLSIEQTQPSADRSSAPKVCQMRQKDKMSLIEF